MNPDTLKRSIKYEIRFRPHEDAAIRASAQQLQITVTEALRGWIRANERAGLMRHNADRHLLKTEIRESAHRSSRFPAVQDTR